MIKRDKFGRFKKGYKGSPRTKRVKYKISQANSGSGNGRWKGGKSEGKCKICGKKFYFYPSSQKGIFCSVKCSNSTRNPVWLHTPELIKKNTNRLLKLIENEETHPRWKGDDVGYIALHQWVRKHKGEPNECEMCKTKTAKKFEWANISGEYKRELNDWTRLCTKCHHEYDNIYTKLWKTRKINLTH